MGKPKIALPLSNMLPSVLSTGMNRDPSSYVPSMCSREAKMPEDIVSTLVFVQLRKGQGGMLIGHM